MAMSNRTRQERPDKTANLGYVGRKTGIAMPSSVPLNDEGVEDFEAFFTSPNSIATSLKKQQQPAQRRQERPDKADDLGYVGRKTGTTIKGAPRNSKGVEDIDAFYKSPTEPSLTAKSIKMSSAKRQDAETPIAGNRRVAQTQNDTESEDMDGANDETMIDYSKASTSRLSSRYIPGREDAQESDDEEKAVMASLSPAASKFKGRKQDQSVNYEMQDFDTGIDVDMQDSFQDDLDQTQIDYSFDYDATHNAQREEGEIPADKLVQQKKRGRPRKSVDAPSKSASSADKPSKKARGRPRKTADENEEDMSLEQSVDISERQPKKKKSKQKRTEGKERSSQVAKVASNSQAKPASKKRKAGSEDIEGLRRSTRQHIEPLEYWRCERIVYGRRESGPQPTYGMKDVVRLPKQSPKSKPHSSQTHRKRQKLATITEAGEANNDYLGWDDTTDPEGLVWDYVSQEEVKRRVAFTSSMISTKPANSKSSKPNSNYRFQKVFTDGDFMAGGVLEIPVNEKKPLKPARDNTYMIYCAKGAVRVLVYRTTFTIANGGFFLVPRGNSYEIENIGNVEAQLVFMQAREIRITEELED